MTPLLTREDIGCWVLKSARLPPELAPVQREVLLADPVAREAEVLRMPAGSNPSWLSPAQWGAVRRLSPTAGRT